MSAYTDTTILLSRAAAGDADASRMLVPRVYEDLHRLAESFLANEQHAHLMQVTLVVHEAFIRLLDGASVACTNRAHFMAIAARTVRRVLVDLARQRLTAKRAGELGARSARPDNIPYELTDRGVIDLHEALEELRTLHERQSTVVELKFFGGLSLDEIAGVLNVSPRTVNADWRFARAWLRKRLDG